MNLKEIAAEIYLQSIDGVLPEKAVKEELEKINFEGNVYVVAIGKAAWRMAKAAVDYMPDRVKKGIVVTKYDHSQGEIPKCIIREAGHPIPDENSIEATKDVLKMTSGLSRKDNILFLVSGGGSALFEELLPGVELSDLIRLTDQLLRCGANIVEINTIRKHLSCVKGGRFAEWVFPAKIETLVLSDVLGDRLDSIASGPAYPDSTTSEDAIAIINKYGLTVKPSLMKILQRETPKQLTNVNSRIIGSVSKLTDKAARVSKDHGFEPLILTTTLEAEASSAGETLAAIVREVKRSGNPVKPPCAIIMGGETIVNVTGDGKGGRNQEFALASAGIIDGLDDVVIAAVGSDGTDGPTDAAGGIVDGSTVTELKNCNIKIKDILNFNDSYYALKEIKSLIITGPTGTNVNDLYFALIAK